MCTIVKDAIVVLCLQDVDDDLMEASMSSASNMVGTFTPTTPTLNNNYPVNRNNDAARQLFTKDFTT